MTTVDKAANRAIFEGILPVFLTPFDDELALDLEAARAEVRWIRQNGFQTIILMGSQGEFFSMSESERKALAHAVVEESGDDINVVVGVSHTATVVACELAAHAESCGAAAVLCTPPFYAKVGPEEVVEHFSQVSQTTQLPVVVYNSIAPGVFPASSVLDRLCDLPRVAAVKHSSPSVTELSDALDRFGDRIAVVGGSENYAWPCLAMGMKGVTSTSSVAMPKPFRRLLEHAQQGELAAGARLHRDLQKLRRLGDRYGRAAVTKVALDIQGVTGFRNRPPLRQLSRRERLDVAAELRAMGYGLDRNEQLEGKGQCVLD